MKKFSKLFLALALLGGLAGAAVSCKDYQEELSSLSAKVDDLQLAVASLQSKIDAGTVITNVEGTSTGWTVYLSDGSHFDIKDGNDGSNGSNGTGGKSPVLSIGGNGNWFVDGVDSGIPATGPAGETGATGATGAAGAAGADGTDGFTPTVEIKNGYWWINGENTGLKAEASDDTAPAFAVWNSKNGTLVFKNVSDENGNTSDLIIYLTNELRSLVLIPPMYIDGIEAIPIEVFIYYPLSKKSVDSKSEVWSMVAANSKTVEEEITLRYHVNPASALVTKDDNLSFIIKNDISSKTGNEVEKWDIDPEFVSCEDGILTVNVKLSTKDLGDGWNTLYVNQLTNDLNDVVDIAALKVVKNNEDKTTVVSDYARVNYEAILGAGIAEPGLEAWLHHSEFSDADPAGDYIDYIDVHYRSLDIDKLDPYAYISDKVVWTATTGTPSMSETHATCDTVVLYNGSIDLKTIVEAHPYYVYSCPVPSYGYNGSHFDMEKLGLSWKFEAVKNYKIGTPETDQANFFDLTADGVLTPKVYGTEGKAAIGRTPIVRVKLMHGDDIVWVSYIKLQIVDKIEKEKDYGITLNVYTKAVDGVIKGFNPDCAGVTRVTSVEETNVLLYNYVGYSKDDFHALFTGSDSWTDYLGNPSDVRDTVVHCPDATNPLYDVFKAIDCAGEVVENAPSSVTGTEATHVLAWKVWAEDIWETEYNYALLAAVDALPKDISTDSLYHHVYYLNPTTGKTVVIRLVAAFDDFNTNIPTANFVPGYWTEEPTAPNGVATEFNVAIPDMAYATDVDTLRSNLHSSFVKYPNTHATAADQTFVDAGITDVNFYFDATQIAKITSIGKYYATFKTNYTPAQVKADPDLNMQNLELTLVKFGTDKDHAATVNVKIAEIWNEAPEATAPRWSVVRYGGNDPEDSGLEFGYGGEDGPSYADSLLNTGAMYTYFGAWGEVCDDAAKTLLISFGDEKASYFRGNFLRPINATTQSPVPFKDHATFNYPGSYINVTDLVDLYDWRNHKFADEEGLWDYYGIDTIVVITDNATTDGGFNTAGTLSGDIKLVQYAAADFTAKYWDAKNKVWKDYDATDAPYGYLTYRNLGTDLKKEYHIWVPVKVNYDWGWYETAKDEMIKITVEPAD